MLGLYGVLGSWEKAIVFEKHTKKQNANEEEGRGKTRLGTDQE